MISVTLSQLTDILNGELQGADITLDAVTTDTRKLTPGCLFVALKGERFDAHDFADQAKAGGAGALLVSRPLDIDLPQLIVKDTRLAFGELAAWVRQQVPARVVALTGSSGKTSVKEMTAGDFKPVRQHALYGRQSQQRHRCTDDAVALNAGIRLRSY